MDRNKLYMYCMQRWGYVIELSVNKYIYQLTGRETHLYSRLVFIMKLSARVHFRSISHTVYAGVVTINTTLHLFRLGINLMVRSVTGILQTSKKELSV